MPTFHFKIRRSPYGQNKRGAYWFYFTVNAPNLADSYHEARKHINGFGKSHVAGPFAITLEEYENATRKPEPSRSTALSRRAAR